MSKAAPVRRPRDRKQQIINSAAQLFCEQGYHNVTLAEVASSVGITAGALYRHFRNKDELLLRTVQDGIHTVEIGIAESPDLDALLQSTAAGALDRRGLPLLWQRESRHLPSAEREQLRHAVSDIADKIGVLIRSSRPELEPADVTVLSWAVIAVFGSFGMRRIPLPKNEFRRLHLRLSSAVARSQFNTEGAPQESAPLSDVAMRTGVELPRREQLVTAAIRLFAERGFQSVTMDDIGTAAGITGSSVYKHFPTKIALLVAALERGHARLHTGMGRALALGKTPTEVLDLLTHKHIEFALENSQLISILGSEREELPEENRKVSNRAQRDYLNVWMRVLAECRPELKPEVVRITVDAVFTVIGNLAAMRSLATRTDLSGHLFDLATALLWHEAA